MTRAKRGRRAAPLDARAFPVLAEFARAYLHEDLVPEYGDAAGAVGAYCRDASPGERRALAADLVRLVELARDRPAPALRRFFREALGAAWSPPDVSALAALAEIPRGG